MSNLSKVKKNKNRINRTSIIFAREDNQVSKQFRIKFLLQRWQRLKIGRRNDSKMTKLNRILLKIQRKRMQ